MIYTLMMRRSKAYAIASIAVLGCLPSALVQQTPTPRTVIVIDPGHPSEVSRGTETQNGTTEVENAW